MPAAPIPSRFSERSDVRAAVLLACNLAIVLGSGVAAWHIGAWWAYVLAFVLVGARGQACYILQHEMMHNLLFTSPALNQRLGVITSAVLGTRFYIGRQLHWDHHRHVGAPHDPNEAFHNVEERPPGMAVVKFFLFHLLGGRLLMMAENLIAAIRPPSGQNGKVALPAIPAAKTKIDLAALMAVQLTALIVMTWTSSLLVYVCLYVLPLATLTAFFEAIRSFSEHVLPGDATCEAEENRRFLMDAGPLETFFISQFDFHYHHVHHLYPNVVTFKVRELHHWLCSNDPDYTQRFITRPGYVGTAVRYLRGLPFPGAGSEYPPGIARRKQQEDAA
ncbi:fatty acid desaturase family protein [Bradyrhizobium barranii]|uniref:fatty acid desaturase family protein n=1 Tax=Bradyrhizobium TaxID=374 RepID=UPI003F22158B